MERGGPEIVENEPKGGPEIVENEPKGGPEIVDRGGLKSWKRVQRGA